MNEALKHSLKNLFAKEKTKMKVDWILHGFGSHIYDEKNRFTKETEGELISQGYKRAYGLKDGFGFINVPVYLKKSYFREFQIPEGGPRDTAYTLNDFNHTTAFEQFKKNLTKLTMFGDMQIKTIGVIVVVIAIAAGFILLFGGAF